MKQFQLYFSWLISLKYTISVFTYSWHKTKGDNSECWSLLYVINNIYDYLYTVDTQHTNKHQNFCTAHTAFIAGIMKLVQEECNKQKKGHNFVSIGNED